MTRDLPNYDGGRPRSARRLDAGFRSHLPDRSRGGCAHRLRRWGVSLVSAESRRPPRRLRRLGTPAAGPRLARPDGRRRGRSHAGRPGRAVGTAGRRQRHPTRRGGLSRRDPATADPGGSGEVRRRGVEHGLGTRAGPRGTHGPHGRGDRSRSGAAGPVARFRGQDGADGSRRCRTRRRVQRTIGGVLFTLEEVTKSFLLKTVLATLFSAAAGVACSRGILGNHADFHVEPLGAPALAWLPLFVLYGLLTGCVGAGYNRLVLWFLDHVAAIRRIPSLMKAAVVGAVIGLAMFIYPLSVGGGEDLTARILGGQHLVLTVVIGILAVRFVAGPLSYSAAVPGGLFAPLLAVGALWGLLFAGGFNALWPGNAT